mmetsp:Transcript_70510/g.206319  ORF Transcript_70510/g.206319 Transcript_70510/m.206319 type:complete len:246 (+) Transcript_70510:1551-2288(+)
MLCLLEVPAPHRRGVRHLQRAALLHVLPRGGLLRGLRPRAQAPVVVPHDLQDGDHAPELLRHRRRCIAGHGGGVRGGVCGGVARGSLKSRLQDSGQVRIVFLQQGYGGLDRRGRRLGVQNDLRALVALVGALLRHLRPACLVLRYGRVQICHLQPNLLEVPIQLLDVHRVRLQVSSGGGLRLLVPRNLRLTPGVVARLVHRLLLEPLDELRDHDLHLRQGIVRALDAASDQSPQLRCQCAQGRGL